MVLIILFFLFGIVGLLVIETLNKFIDFFSLFRGDWDLLIKPRPYKMIQSWKKANSRNNKEDTFKFPHPESRFQGDAYEILGLNKKDRSLIKLDDLKKAYREMIYLYHPDLYIQSNSDLYQEAERRSKLINVSYHKLRSEI